MATDFRRQPRPATGHCAMRVLVLIAMIFIFPLVFMVMSSLKPDQQLLADTASLRAFLPVGDISLDNYIAAFQRAPVALSSSTRSS